jgi:hypothetical protein
MFKQLCDPIISPGPRREVTIDTPQPFGGRQSDESNAAVLLEVSPFLACIGSPCLRHCAHGVPIGVVDAGGHHRAGGDVARAPAPAGGSCACLCPPLDHDKKRVRDSVTEILLRFYSNPLRSLS